VPGQNVFGSSEYLWLPTYGQCQAWKDTFMSTRGDNRHNVLGEQQKWNLQVVITYRRLHSYLPSAWNQQYKYFRKTGSPIHLGHRDWPGTNDDIRIPSFEEWFVEEYYDQPQHLHPARDSFHAWTGCSDGITIVNIHDLKVQRQHGGDGDGDGDDMEGDLVTNFVCKALKGANQTCSNLLHEKKSKTKPNHPQTDRASTGSRRRRLSQKNKSVSLDHDMLAVHAYATGLIGVDQQQGEAHFRRHHITREIQEHAELHEIDLPQKCPNSTVLDYIYKWSLESEQWVLSHMEYQQSKLTSSMMKLGTYHNLEDDPTGTGAIESKPLTDEQLSDFNADWEQLLFDEKLCSVDVVETLKQERWQEFFRKSFA